MFPFGPGPGQDPFTHMHAHVDHMMYSMMGGHPFMAYRAQQEQGPGPAAHVEEVPADHAGDHDYGDMPHVEEPGERSPGAGGALTGSPRPCVHANAWRAMHPLPALPPSPAPTSDGMPHTHTLQP